MPLIGMSLIPFLRKRVEANFLFAVDLVQKSDIYLVIPLEFGFSIYKWTKLINFKTGKKSCHPFVFIIEGKWS